MNETRKIPFPDLIDALPEGCRRCSVARFTLERISTDEGSIIVIEDIKANCGGWRGDEEPHESLLATDGNPALSLSKAIEENCPYALGQQA